MSAAAGAVLPIASGTSGPGSPTGDGEGWIRAGRGAYTPLPPTREVARWTYWSDTRVRTDPLAGSQSGSRPSSTGRDSKRSPVLWTRSRMRVCVCVWGVRPWTAPSTAEPGCPRPGSSCTATRTCCRADGLQAFGDQTDWREIEGWAAGVARLLRPAGAPASTGDRAGRLAGDASGASPSDHSSVSGTEQ